MKFNFTAITQYLMILALTIAQFTNFTPDQKREYIKEAFETLDSLNKRFAIKIEGDSTLKSNITVIPTIDSVRLDGVKIDTLNFK